MPPLPDLHDSTLRALAERLAGSRRAVAECLDRVEALAADADAAGVYPEDFVVFRLTGERPEIALPRMIAGADLLASLSAFAEHVGEAARLELDAERTRSGADRLLRAEELAAEWKVSRKTVDRLRKLGLIARRVRGSDGKPRLVFRESVARAFRARHAERIGKAAGFTRIDEETAKKMIRRAARYRARFGCSLNEAAARLAERYGRSLEGVRRLLQRHEKSAAPIFSESGPIDRKFGRFAHRAWLRGFDSALLARRRGRSRAGVQRAINLARLELLQGLLHGDALACHEVPMFTNAGAAERLLSPAPVRTGLDVVAEEDLLDLVRVASVRSVAVGVEESTRAAAYHYLKFAVRGEIAALSRSNPATGGLDRVETMLRHAARLKAALMRPQLRLVVDTLESGIGRALTSVRAQELGALVEEAISTTSEAVEQFDPFRHLRQRGATVGRLAAPVGLAVGRLAARWAREHAEAEVGKSRARPTLSPGYRMPDWTVRVAAWQSFLEPDPRVRGVVRGGVRAADGEGGEEAVWARVLAMRFGWDGGKPRMIDEVAGEFGWTHIRAVKEERRALVEGMRRAREGGGAGRG